MGSIEVVGETRALLGECPVWSTTERVLYWEDIDGRAVHRYDPSTGVDDVRTLPGRPGSFVLTADDDRIMVGLEHGLAELRWSSGAVSLGSVVEAGDAPTRLNDGRADPSGRYWVGSMDDPSDAGRYLGTLHRVDTDGSVTHVQGGVGVSNGMAFSPDGTVMYWADSPRELVWAYDYDVATGERRNERVFLDFATLPGKPDGACVDESGSYWVACVLGGAVLRATPDGRVDRVIEVPVDMPTMPAFGGDDLDVMYLTSIGLAAPAMRGKPLAGALLRLDGLGVRGLPEHRFGG